jgi:formylglycine-generating enzyme required for sulfatase activity/tRNA A-37 threonylcarbamoyl transferase component Bud32
VICPSCKAENDEAHDTCFQCGKALVRVLVQGSVLAGRYEILSPIGKGGMGMVYKARDRFLHDEIVAIKVMRSDILRAPEQARRFRSEILLARKVRHRNVCGIYEYNHDGDLELIAMELIEGKDYRRILRERGPLPPAEAFAVAIQITEGLEAVHEAGIVHRDLKTPNVMRDSRGVARLMDFGIAKSLANDTGGTATGAILGTPEYMSPEQVRGEKVDARSDLYAMGVLIWELFTGRVPFQGDTPVATLFLHVQQPPPFDSDASRGLPGPLVPVLRRALAKRPDERYASAREMLDALREAERQTVGGAASAPQTLSASPTLASDLRRDIAEPTLVDAALPKLAPPTPPARSTTPLPPLAPSKPARGGLPLLIAGGLVFVAAALFVGYKLGTTPSPKPAATAGDASSSRNTVDGLEYVLVPAGGFEMGCVPTDTLCEDAERPAHHVQITRPFLLGRTEVTVEAFGRFVEKTGHQTTAEKPGSGDGLDLEAGPKRDWRHPGFPQEPRHPVVHVSWDDAAAFCAWSGGRLPTEAEWEYAARGGRAGARYVWGDDEVPAAGGKKHANIADESAGRRFPEWKFLRGYDDGFVYTAPVGSFEPNGFGLADMAGNVWEWCADGFDPAYYARNVASDPTGAEPARERVRRGGAWDSLQPRPLRASNRDGQPPQEHFNSVGFRCAASAP